MSDPSKGVAVADPVVVSFLPPKKKQKTEKYFDMKKTQCKEGLDIYKKFLTRMTRISEFLKVAEVVAPRPWRWRSLPLLPLKFIRAAKAHL